MPRVDVQNVVKWLSDAPRIAKNQSPFHWTYLDGPVDGTVLLTWQPLARLGTGFASDGFIWAGPEQRLQQDLGNGLERPSHPPDSWTRRGANSIIGARNLPP